MLVFDNIDRTLIGGADYEISHFDYLNLSCRPEAARVREFIEEAVKHFPSEYSDSLISRLRSRFDTEHLSASFELILHELFFQNRCQISFPEHESDSVKAPDFHITAPDGSTFYVEATLATGRSDKEEAAGRRLKDVFQAIESIESPDFFLTLRTRGTPRKPLPVGRLKEKLEKWLTQLDYDSVAAGERVDDYVYRAYGCRIEINVLPKTGSRGQESGRTVGLYSSEAKYIDKKAIKKSMKKKSTRYGMLDSPYIVAINTLEHGIDRDDMIDALFGTFGVCVQWQGEYEASQQEFRHADGAWNDSGGPVNTRVSGALITKGLSFWSLGQQRQMRLFYNPWAREPLEGFPLRVTTYFARDDFLEECYGFSVAELLNLEEGWPERYS